jgi:hypothetical protein
MYKPSCLIEAYGGPENFRLVAGGQLANNLLNLNIIFLSDSAPVAAE